MALEPDVLRRKGADVDEANPVSLAGLDLPLEVLRLVDQGVVRHRLGAAGVDLADEGADELGELVVIPIRHGQDHLLVELVLVRVVRVVDDERPPEAVRVLRAHVAVIPVRPGLLDLKVRLAGFLADHPGGRAHTVKL